MTRTGTVFVSSLLLFLGATLVAQDKGGSVVDKDGGPVTAYLCKRVVTVSGAPIDDAVILVQDGTIKAVGGREGVPIPATAKRVDASTQTALPGFVHPASLAFSGKSRHSTSGKSTSGDKKVSASLTVTRRGSEAFARAGYTTIAVIPTGGGVTGLGCLLRPTKDGEELLNLSDLLAEDGVVLSMGFASGTASKKAWIDLLAKARKYLADLAAFEKAKGEKPEKKPAKKPEKKPAAAKPAKSAEKKSSEKPKQEDPKKKPAEKASEKKPEPKKPTEPKKDPKLMPLVDVISGRQAGVLAMGTTKDLLHFADVFASEKSFRPTLLLSASGVRSRVEAWRLVDQIKELGVPLIMGAGIGAAPRSITRRVEQRILLDAGVPIALVPGPALPNGEQFRFRLSELVRHGLRADEVLRAVTLTPAEILGIQARCGSLEAGKDADILLFSGDPLEPTSDLVEVLVGGETVYRRGEGNK
ncbi:MAG: hypothetical protein CMJ90_07610 [Planctomycetes bacterium]|nr:hypothetical protein [Planctomycetota bacterium]